MFIKTIVIAVTMCAAAAITQAQTVHTSRAVYNAAHSATSVIDFNNYTPGPIQTNDVSATVPAGNVPEPATTALAALGAIAILLAAGRRRG